jgi:ubiquinone/menaquinone biosynthesis C-methylase UbiE
MSATESAPGAVPPRGMNETVAHADARGSAAITSQAIAPLLAAARIAPGARVLDVGCGLGRAAAAAANQGASSCGVDKSATQVAAAARRFPTIAFLQADAAELPFSDESFDAVISNFGIPHFRDPDGFLREAFRVLRRGGVIAFTAWIDPTQEELSEPDGVPQATSEFFRFGEGAHCRIALANAGFKAVAIEAAHVAWRSPATDALLEAVMAGVVRAATLLNAETADAQAMIRDAVRARIEADIHDGAFALVMPAIVVSARKTSLLISARN